MIAQFVRLAFRDELLELRRMRTRAVASVAALVPFAVGTSFALVALFLWLAERMAGWQAAAIVAVISLLLGLVLLLFGRLAGARPVRPAPYPAAAARAPGEKPPEDAPTPLSTVTAALAAGIVLGRNLSR